MTGVDERKVVFPTRVHRRRKIAKAIAARVRRMLTSIGIVVILAQVNAQDAVRRSLYDAARPETIFELPRATPTPSVTPTATPAPTTQHRLVILRALAAHPPPVPARSLRAKWPWSKENTDKNDPLNH